MAKAKSYGPVRTGALTILIATVVMCLAVLSVLALTTARANLQVVKKQQQYMEKQAQAETLGQQWLAQVDATLADKAMALPPEATLQPDGTITGALDVGDGTVLSIAVQPLKTGKRRYQIVRWQMETDWQPGETLSLWPGN